MVNNKDKSSSGSNARSYPDNASIIAGIDAALIAIKAGGAGGHLSVGQAGVSILMSYGENPHYVKLPIFSEFMENSTKFMKNSDLTKWTQNLR